MHDEVDWVVLGIQLALPPLLLLLLVLLLLLLPLVLLKQEQPRLHFHTPDKYLISSLLWVFSCISADAVLGS